MVRFTNDTDAIIGAFLTHARLYSIPDRLSIPYLIDALRERYGEVVALTAQSESPRYCRRHRRLGRRSRR